MPGSATEALYIFPQGTLGDQAQLSGTNSIQVNASAFTRPKLSHVIPGRRVSWLRYRSPGLWAQFLPLPFCMTPGTSPSPYFVSCNSLAGDWQSTASACEVLSDLTRAQTSRDVEGHGYALVTWSWHQPGAWNPAKAITALQCLSTCRHVCECSHPTTSSPAPGRCSFGLCSLAALELDQRAL